jgi:hypothetical protein
MDKISLLFTACSQPLRHGFPGTPVAFSLAAILRGEFHEKRIAALVFISVCTSIAWAILGATISSRAYSPASDDLKSRLSASWGTAKEQNPPTANYRHEVISTVETEKGTKQIKTIETFH